MLDQCPLKGALVAARHIDVGGEGAGRPMLGRPAAMAAAGAIRVVALGAGAAVDTGHELLFGELDQAPGRLGVRALHRPSR